MEFTNPFPNLKEGERPSKEDIVSALRLSLAAEEDATHLYNQIADLVSDERISKVMRDVANEEQVHKGEFQKLIELLEGDEVSLVRQGKEEAEELSVESKIIDEIAESLDP
jgi:rubrerythrin